MLESSIINELKRCKTFDDIMVIVYTLKIKNFNSLSVYDTSLRLGAIFNLYPKVIYLHAGATEGAVKLLGKETYNKNTKYFIDDQSYPYVEKSIFPEELQILEPYHIENFLCIEKERIHSIDRL